MPVPKIAYTAGMVLRRNAPTILTTAGVVGFCVTTALTAKATAKAIQEIPGVKKKVQEARDLVVSESLSERDRQEALVKAYLEGGVVLGKVYGPTIVVGVSSIVCVLAGHGLLLRRNAAIAAAYTAMSASYKAYRDRVANEVGAEKELEIYRGQPYQEVLGEDGQVCEIRNPNLPSAYARYFEKGNKNWSPTPEYNMVFLKTQEQYFNQRLGAKGYLFLNEVYEHLGYEWTQAGQVVGWKSDANENGTGDGYVDLGLHDVFNENTIEFVNGREPVVLIDPNVDGPIII